jgi:hypothetical protein
MKKLLLLLCSVLLLAKANAQLTYGQVYNFNVGDVFEAKSCGDACYTSPPTYTLTIVLQKWYSVTSDSIYYKDSVVTYTSPHCMTCSGSLSTAIDTLMVDSLTYPAISGFNFLFGNACPVVDTIIDSGFCDKKIWMKYPDKNCIDSSFEPVTSTAWVVEGCGGGYFSAGDPTVPMSVENDLIYYKKGTDSCGSKVIITGINELQKQAAQIKLYPNPSNGKFSIEIKNEELRTKNVVEIYNMIGEKVYSNSFSIQNPEFKIDLTGQPGGIYLYRITNEEGNLVSSGKFEIE